MRMRSVLRRGEAEAARSEALGGEPLGDARAPRAAGEDEVAAAVDAVDAAAEGLAGEATVGATARAVTPRPPTLPLQPARSRQVRSESVP